MKNDLQTFPVAAGLLEPRHIQAIDPSSPVWVYLWFLNRVTIDQQNGEDFVGIVLNGRPIGVRQIADELGMKERACRRHLARLVKAGYVVQKQTGVGTCTYTVTKSKKWAWKRQPRVDRSQSSKAPESQASLFPAQDGSGDAPHQKVARGSEADPRPPHQILVGPDQKVVSAERERARGYRKPQRSKPSRRSKPSPDGAVKKATSKLSGESSTIRERENSAGAPAAKLSSQTQHAVVERFIKSKYQDANGLPCPWNGRTGKTLKDFLNPLSGWTTEAIRRCVANRFKSEGVALAEDPVYWIPRLASFLQGPKDKFGKTRAELAAAQQTKAPRAVANVSPPKARPENLALLKSWKKEQQADDGSGFLEEPRAIGRLQ